MMNPDHQWRNIPGYDGYWISEYGEIWSGKSQRILKAKSGSSGYPKVELSGQTLSIHRLVALAFYGPSDLPVVRHLDDNKLNNHFSNLAWGTTLENNRDIVQHGRHANQKKTHCSEGHEYNQENTYWLNGHRYCRICRDSRQRERRKFGLPVGSEKHGTRTGYVYGCRCERCLNAEKSYQANYRKKDAS